MDGALRPVLVVSVAVAFSLIAGWVVDRSLRRVDARHPEHRCGTCCAAAGYRSRW